MSTWAKRGFKAAEAEAKRQAARKSIEGIYELWMRDGDEVIVRFLHTEPLTFNVHRIVARRKGKEFLDRITCPGKGCRYCKDGDRPQYVGAWLVLNYTHPAWDKEKKKVKKVNGEIVYETRVQLWIRGITDINLIKKRVDRCDGEFPMYTVAISRVGSAKATTYDYEVQSKEKLSKDDKKLLEEKGVPFGDDDAVLDFLEKLVAPEDVEDDEDYEDSNKKSFYRPEDDDEDDDEDDEAEKPLKKSTKKQKKPPAKKAVPRYDDEDDDEDDEYGDEEEYADDEDDE